MGKPLQLRHAQDAQDDFGEGLWAAFPLSLATSGDMSCLHIYDETRTVRAWSGEGGVEWKRA